MAETNNKGRECPICKNRMKKKVDYNVVVWDQIDGETEYEKVISYTCKKNHPLITYNENEDSWDVADEIAPTEKQINTAFLIERFTGKKAPKIPLKKEYWKFINENLSLAIQNQKKILMEDPNSESLNGFYSGGE